MAPRIAPPPLQFSWVEGETVAWQPGRGIYGGNLHEELTRLARRGRLPYGGATRVVPMQVPTGRVNVMVQRVDATTLASLGQLEVLHDGVSPSVAWFGAMHRRAEQLVLAGRVSPSLTHLTGGWWVAQWNLLPADVEAAAPLLSAMPPVVAAYAPVDSAEVLRQMADRLVRLTLGYSGWAAPLNETRSVHARAMRLVTRALSATNPQFVVVEDLAGTTQQIAEQFRLLGHRAEGRPVLVARLRLGLPGMPVSDATLEADEPGFIDTEPSEPDPDAWPLTLELCDLDDRSRWCTDDDVMQGAEAALELAREARHLPSLDEALLTARAAIAEAVPSLQPWLGTGLPTVSLEQAAHVLERIEALTNAGVEVVAPQKLVRRKPSSRATAEPNDSKGSGRFAASALVHWDVVVDGQEVPEHVLQRAAEDGATLIQAGGRWVQVDRAEARRALQALEQHRTQHSEMSALELLALAAELERELEAAGVAADDTPPVFQGSGWVADLLAGMPDTGIHDGVVPAGFTATLRPYQLRGLGWLQFLRRLGLGGCLADDMGLGKTPTTLAHLAGLPGPHLVVCPLSVVRNWQSEAARFAPGMRVMAHHGSGRASGDDFVALAAMHDLVITTYQLAARDVGTLQQVGWSTVVLDEAQAVKNHDTAASRAVRSLPAEQRLALTGTPVENRLSELWAIFQVVVPGLLGNFTQFRHRFANPIERNRDAAAAAALRTLTAPFLLRRTKADRSLVPDLPDKVEQVAWAPLTREQAHLYQAVVDQLLLDSQQATGMRRRGLVLAALTRLKQICNHPAHALGDGSRLAGRSGKLNRFDELVTDLLDLGEQGLVFTQFREMGTLLQQHLEERFGLKAPFLHGGVPKSGRDRMVAEFQQGGVPLLLVSLKAGGTGLNLTAASQVIHYDRWWNPAVEDQATDRAWRIGQQRAVMVHKLVCEGTVEERIDALINDKRGLAASVVGTTGEQWLSELSTDDLRELVRLDLRSVRGS
ncbi:MAG: DEAD/DEAH box helicase [Acidobacteria bacterium]|nr:DEAD/DEAH box helicase [Acidobacteriota bacterium]